MRNPVAFAAITSLVLAGVAAAQSGKPFASGETLYYEVSWPSGLSLGEASLIAIAEAGDSGGPPQWKFEWRLEARVPGFAVSDTVRATANDGFCSLLLEKDLRHGEKHTQERMVFDEASGTATRSGFTGSGASEVIVDGCPKDALSFLYELRDQLARGRIPSPRTVYFGAGYSVEFEHLGREIVPVGGVAVEGDHLRVTVAGPASEHVFDVTVGRDESRRPLRIRVPLELGEFSMQLLP